MGEKKLNETIPISPVEIFLFKLWFTSREKFFYLGIV